MAQFWWVNHNQTARQEIDGQHLWSPKTESNGARSEFHNNMRRATSSDLVLSYADQAIRYIGRIAEFAFTAPKPKEFGETGGLLESRGMASAHLLETLSPSIHPKTIIGSLGPLLPRRYSPFQLVSGSGNQKAYPTGIPQNTFEVVIACATFSRQALSRGRLE
jgi:putative restriction endonuclease